MSTIHTSTGRRHDLDWVRVGAFAFLILYHIGMFYVTWDWHVKSDHASHLIEPAMGILNPWRLALLFFISGVAIRFASDRQSAGSFAWSKVKRLLIPIAFGMFVIVPPQAYLELRWKGEIPADIWAFYLSYASFENAWSIITPTWNHLWYVAYVFVYSLLILPFLPALGRLAGRLERAWPSRGGTVALMIVPALPLLFCQLVLAPRFPTTHALVDDWANHASSLTIFLFGYLAAKNSGFWRTVDRVLPLAGSIALGLAIILFVERSNRAGMPVGRDYLTTIGVLRVIYAWAAILTILALAQRWLNRKSAALTYLSEAVLPYYILHQTIIVVVAYQMIGAGVPAVPEAGIILVATVGGCALFHEFAIRRSRWLRALFGMKPLPGRNEAPAMLPARG
jgi:hypothetical protein